MENLKNCIIDEQLNTEETVFSFGQMSEKVKVENKFRDKFNSIHKDYEDSIPRKVQNNRNANIPKGDISETENGNIVFKKEINVEDSVLKSCENKEVILSCDLNLTVGEAGGKDDKYKFEIFPKCVDTKKENSENFQKDSVLFKSETIEIGTKLNDAGKNTITGKSRGKNVGATTKKDVKSKKTNSVMKIYKKTNSSEKNGLAIKTGKTKHLEIENNESSSSSIFEVNIPLIGKNIFVDTENPFHARYDLAIEINKKRYRHQKKEGFMIPKTSFDEWRKERDSKSDAEKKEIVAKEKQENLEMAHDITRIGIRILQLLLKDVIDEKRIGRLLIEFLFRPVTPTSLLYVPHFVHTIMFCRGCKDFSRQLRSLADECYQRCHAMFPVPHGYNFETMYTYQVRKFLPEIPIRLDEILPDYDDFSDSSDSENTYTI